jgi:hypothetical protein
VTVFFHDDFLNKNLDFFQKKVIIEFRSVIININFLFHSLLHLFISIYYDKSSPFNL